MANTVYGKFKKDVVQEGHQLQTDTIKLTLLVNGTFTDHADGILNTTNFPLADRANLTAGGDHAGETLTIGNIDAGTAGTITATCPAISGIDGDPAQVIEAVVIWNDTNADKVICWIDTGTNLGTLSTNGNDIDVTVGTLLTY